MEDPPSPQGEPQRDGDTSPTIITLARTLARVLNELETAKSALEIAQTQNNNWAQRFQEVSEKYTEAEGALINSHYHEEELREKIESLDTIHAAQRKEASEKLHAAEKKIFNLEVSLSAERKNYDELQSQYATVIDDHSQIFDEKKRLEAKIAELNLKIKDLEDRHDGDKQAYNWLMADYKILESNLGQANKDIENLKRQMSFKQP